MPSRKRKTPPAAPEPAPEAAPPRRTPRAADPAPLDETRAHDLLPSEPPPPPTPRKVALRRVVGHDTTERLLARRAFRPAGNSRRFWSKVEEDDPFLPGPRPSRAAEETATLSPAAARAEPSAAERLPRAEPKSRSRPAPPPARPRDPTHLPETRTAPPPRPAPRSTPPPPPRQPPPPPRPTPRAAPPPAPEPPAPPEIDRRPPRIVEPNGPSGPRIPAQPTVQRQLVTREGKTATQVRQEAERARAAVKPGSAMPPPRSLDEVLGILGSLANSERLYREGRPDEATEAAPDTRLTKPNPRPAPRPAPEAPRATPPPAPPRAPPRPAPAPARASDDDDGPPPAPPRVDRSPGRASSGPSLDDLFGANEGRVKVGRRTVPKGRDGEGQG